MSLIQEALRRQQEEMDDHSGVPAAPATPATPSPSPQQRPTIARKSPINADPQEMDSSAPPPVQEPPKVKGNEEPPPPPDELAESETEQAPPGSAASKDKPGAKVALIVLGAVLCLGLGVWAVTYAVQSLMTGDPAPVEPAGEPAPDPVTPENPDSANVPTAPVTPQPEPAQPVQVKPSPVTTKPVPQPPPPVVAVEPVIWPMLVVNGLVGKGAQGSVMINNQIIGVDESIEDVRVVSISRQGATLEYRGEQKFVKVGTSTE